MSTVNTAAASPDAEPILQVRNLVKTFSIGHGAFKKASRLTAVSDVSFDVRKGEILGLLGESGCGKTTLARMIMHLAKPTSGSIVLNGRETQGLSERSFRNMRRDIQMVYQNPFDCLDPSWRVGRLLEEPLKVWYPKIDKSEREERIGTMLGECGLDRSCLSKYPSEFSGGQLQRIAIARALLVSPKLLIADEIVSALDVPVQNQILQLLAGMKEQHGFSTLFITHDLPVARSISDRVMVMGQGRLLAIGTPQNVLDKSDDPIVRKLASSAFTFSGTA